VAACTIKAVTKIRHTEISDYPATACHRLNKQEFMKFMEAEFARLDKDNSG